MNPNESQTLRIGNVFSESWDMLKKNRKVLLSALLLYMIPTVILSMLTGNSNDRDATAGEGILKLISWVVSMYLAAGIFEVIRKVKFGEAVKATDVFQVHPKLLPYMIVSIVLGFMIGFGLILLIVPGIYLALTYGMTPFLVLDKKLSMGDAFKESARITKGSKWTLLGLVIVSILVNVLGALALIIGLLFTAPFTELVWLNAYFTLRDRPATS